MSNPRHAAEAGYAHLAARRWAEARAAFAAALTEAGTDAALWAGYAEALHESGCTEQAVEAAARASDLRPSADNWAALAQACLAADRTDEAGQAAERAVALDAGHAPSLRILSLVALRRQRVADAEAFALAALRTDAAYPEGLAALALVRMMQNGASQADALFSQATAAKPTLAEAFANHAALLARMGRDAEAVAAAERAVELKPFLSQPLNLLGTLHRRNGRLAEAARRFGEAFAAASGHAVGALNLADTLRLMGEPNRAAAVCRTALAHHPGHAGLLGNLGAAVHLLDHGPAAEAAYRRALAVDSSLAEVENNLGRLLHTDGRLDEALGHLRRAAAARPLDPRIAGNLVAALLDAGRTEEAGGVAAVAVQSNRSDSDALLTLGRVLLELDRPAEAEAAFREAANAAAAPVAASLQAAGFLVRAGERARALPFLLPGLRDGSAGARGWLLFGEALRGLRGVPQDPAVVDALLAAFAQPAVEKAHLAGVCVALLDGLPAMARLDDALAAAQPDAAVLALLRDGLLDPVAAAPLLHALLEWVVVADPRLEPRLTVLRRALLADAAGDGAGAVDRAPWDAFTIALARQCFLNEYAWQETPAEAEALARLDEGLHRALTAGAAVSAARIALYAAYRPLAAWGGADAVLLRRWPTLMAGLVEQQIAEPRAEAAIAGALPTLTPIDDPVSQAVRRQYEENPYPRWRHAALIDRPRPMPRLLGALFPHVALSAADWSAPDVLIAGCGTGRESVWAANHVQGARILAVDLSRASLSYAVRQTERLAVAGITYAQADLLRLGELGRTYDVIQCVGVLHHTTDPFAAWRALTALLRPHGVMKIGLYSELARGAVVAAQALAREHGLTASVADIRRLRRIITGLPSGHPARALEQSPDFYSVSACRDLVLHVQEHRVTLPQVADWIERLGLELLGFQFDDPAVARLYRQRFPEDPGMTRLDLWHRFETEHPFTFGGLYQLWLRHRA